MKTHLQKNLMMIVAFCATITMSAQTYNFTGGDQGWVKGYGNGTVAHDPTGGVAGDGALTLDRNSDGNPTNNNANIRRGQGDDPTFVIFDADVINYVKVRVLNQTKATNFRVAGQSRPTSTDPSDNFNAININNVLVAENPEYQTVYLDVSSITGEVTRLDFLLRAGGALTDNPGSKLFFDEIEFLAELPSTTYNEFIQNPSFDGPSGIVHLSGSSTGASRSLTSTEYHDGTHSLRYTYNADASGQFWAFSDYEKTYPSVYTAGSKIQVKIWVKTNRTNPITIQTRLKLSNGGVENDIKPIADATTTNTAMGWEELTFNIETTEDFDGVTLWFNIFWADETEGAVAENVNAGDLIYVDEMSAAIMPEGLSVAKNTLEGVSIYPNPVKETLSINSPVGSDIVIYNVLGAVVKTLDNASALQEISVSSLKSGLYLVKVLNQNKVYQSKIVKK